MKVLCYGKTQSRVQRRCEVVSAAGHSPDSATNYQDALRLAETNQYDALVVGQLVPQGERTEIVQKMRARNPKLLVVFLYEDSIRGAEIADAVLNGFGDVNDIVHTLEFLERRNSSASLPG